jgi:acyl carrier protein phosphodiesterase
MNYLAHLYLAEDSPESLLGNLIGDFLKGTTVDSYSESIRKGIQLINRLIGILICMI